MATLSVDIAPAMDRIDRTVLSERDSKRVLKLLENPPKPTAALKAAARRRAARHEGRISGRLIRPKRRSR